MVYRAKTKIGDRSEPSAVPLLRAPLLSSLLGVRNNKKKHMSFSTALSDKIGSVVRINPVKQIRAVILLMVCT